MVKGFMGQVSTGRMDWGSDVSLEVFPSLNVDRTSIDIGNESFVRECLTRESFVPISKIRVWSR